MLNFDNICRTCSLQGELQPLFVEDLLNPVEMLTEIINIKIIKGDKYPQNICTRCLDTLRSAYMFKNQCLDAYKKFELYLSLNSESNIDSKEEPINAVFIKEEKLSDDDWFELDSQLENTTEKKLYKCETCDEKFENQINYERHLKKHKLYICPDCDYKFTNSSALKQHSIKHSDEKPIKCEKCSAQFKYLHHYRKHFQTHVKSYICSVCGSQFQSKTRLEQHSREHYNEKTNLDEDCGNKITETTKIPRKKKYLCDYCGRSYPHPTKLQEHIRTHTGEKPFACIECNKFFTSLPLWNHHNQIIHTKEKRYECTFCEKTFSMSHALRDHLRIHTNDKPFECDICNQKFRVRHHLIRHQFVHTGEKPFSCNICDKKFTQNSNLRSHMRTHTSSLKNHKTNHVLQ